MIPERSDLSWSECRRLLDGLPGMTHEERVNAVRLLVRNPGKDIRQRTLQIGATLIAESDLEHWIRNESDDVLRNAGLEILKLRGEHSFSFALHLLGDADDDVVLQAVLILDHIDDPRALESIIQLLRHPDPNVVQASIVAIGHMGNERSVVHLEPFLKMDPWLQVASIQAFGDLGCEQAVDSLEKCLSDHLLGPFAIDALAHIGGPTVISILVRHWLSYSEQADHTKMMEVLVHVLEGLTEPCVLPPEFRVRLAEYLNGPGDTTGVQAAKCLLLLGEGAEDERSLEILESVGVDSELPVCLRKRGDLSPLLLQARGEKLGWAFQLVGENIGSAPEREIADSIEKLADPTHAKYISKLLQDRKSSDLLKAALLYFERLDERGEIALLPVLRENAKEILSLSPESVIKSRETLVLLQANISPDVTRVVELITELPPAERFRVVRLSSENRELMALLPWRSWMTEDESSCATLLGIVAPGAELFTLLPLMREIARKHPYPDLLRAVAGMKDLDSVELLKDIYDDADPATRALVLDCLGTIGGEKSRSILRDVIRSKNGKEQSFAYRALSHCAEAEDEDLFRDVVTHSDWMIRMACVQMLGRFPTSDNISLLLDLTSDPVATVSAQAKRTLDS